MIRILLRHLAHTQVWLLRHPDADKQTRTFREIEMVIAIGLIRSYR